MADSALQRLTAGMQSLPHQGRGLSRVGRQVRREFDLDARSLVQFDDPRASRSLHRMMAVGDDRHRRRLRWGRTAAHSQAVSLAARGRREAAGRLGNEPARRASAESMQARSRTQCRSGNDKETETAQPRFPAEERKGSGANGSVVMKQMRLGCCYNKPASANENRLPLPTMK